MALTTHQKNLVKRAIEEHEIIFSCNTGKQIINPEDAINSDFTKHKGNFLFWFNIHDPNGSTGTIK